MSSPTRPEQPNTLAADILSTEHTRKLAEEVDDFLERYETGALTDVAILEILAGNNMEVIQNTSGLPNRIKRLRDHLTGAIDAGHLTAADASDWVKQLTLLEEQLTKIGKAARYRVARNVQNRLFPGSRIITDRLRACAGRRSSGAPAVSPVDEFGCEKQGDRQGELGEAVSWPAVGVAS